MISRADNPPPELVIEDEAEVDLSDAAIEALASLLLAVDDRLESRAVEVEIEQAEATE